MNAATTLLQLTNNPLTLGMVLVAVCFVIAKLVDGGYAVTKDRSGLRVAPTKKLGAPRQPRFPKKLGNDPQNPPEP